VTTDPPTSWYQLGLGATLVTEWNINSGPGSAKYGILLVML